MTEQGNVGAATVQWGVATHVGTAHDNNQDSYCTKPPVFVVADGVGGHSAGELASREAIASLEVLAGQPQVTDEMVRSCLTDARSRIGSLAVEGRPPGTTLTGVIATESEGEACWMVVNIGDSRTYFLDDAGLRQVTIDHSVVQELIDAGVVARSEAESLRVRNQLTRALFADSNQPADTWLLPMNRGDRILVCSDGLSKELDEETIHRMLVENTDPQAAADELVSNVITAERHDDVTVLVVDVVTVSQASTQQVEQPT